ncbi:MAG: histidinol dehydrogenase [Oscillospiraceae bacterium]|nr:histidinol dehydrogenase [Oscillospiraceae bacterium]
MKIIEYKGQPLSGLICRKTEDKAINDIVAKIICDVKTRGDDALFEYAEKFDGAKLNSLEVTQAERKEAQRKLEGTPLLEAMKTSLENLIRYHSAQKNEGFVLRDNDSALGQKLTPLKRAGIYVPGGTASYPSSVLMNAVPAMIAGVSEIYMATPPDADGSVAAPILTAANMCGVKTVYKIGGAGAVAALAYGTDTVCGVDKITGPGNIYVAIAKKQVFGDVDIDMIAGPSEILIVADETASPRYIAADLLSQAEHDVLSAAVLVTTSRSIARHTAAELEKQLRLLSRRSIAETSLQNNGYIIIADTVETAVKISNEFAPEHLELCTQDPFALLGAVENAGSVFLGHMAPEAAGDYIAGTNHVLPTNGSARFSSGLSVSDFVKKISYIYYTRDTLAQVKDKIITFAEAEGLDAHANSVRIRFNQERG